MKYRFVYNDKLELETPFIRVPMEQWTERERNEFYDKAKKISEKIPEKIQNLDQKYLNKYESLQQNPDDFFEIMEELNEISSMISELNALYLLIEGKHLQADGSA